MRTDLAGVIVFEYLPTPQGLSAGLALGPAPWSLVRTGRPGSLPFEAPLPRRA